MQQSIITPQSMSMSACNRGFAISHEAGALERNESLIKGIMVASGGLFENLAQLGTGEAVYCYSHSSRDFEDLCSRVDGRRGVVRWIPYDRPEVLRDVGVLLQLDPGINRLAWQRMVSNCGEYSLCGITHTTCSERVMDAIGDLLVAPVEPWDALVCTSKAARSAVTEMLGTYSAYLAARIGAQPDVKVQLPVIPLGVDCDKFSKKNNSVTIRDAARKHLQVDEDEVVVLFAGRLSFHAKAHPLPMYLALEEAARRTGKTVRLIQTGGLSNASVREEFVGGAKAFCPSVKMTLVDGREPIEYARCWQAADIFTSLSDNIQETFGITPIEAMAAGLPVVVSDWDGYRDTVRHGVDGFRIRTGIPEPGAGEELARRHLLGRDTYDRYIGHASQSTFVDVSECATAYEQLIGSVELRHKMGDAGRTRAKERYDWPVIVRAYEALWEELAERRQKDGAQVTSKFRGHPLRADPYSTYRCYGTTTLDDQTRLAISPRWRPGRLEQLRATPMTSFGLELLASEDACTRITEQVGQGVVEVGDLKEQLSDVPRDVLLRTIGWMIKFDLLQAEGEPVGGK